MSAADASLTLREDSSHRQTRLLLLGGFGGLLLLMGLLGLSANSFLRKIEIREAAIRSDYVERNRSLEAIRSDIYISGTDLRDFLLDESESLAAAHRQQFLRKRSETESEIADFAKVLEPDHRAPIKALATELANYFAIAAPILNWNAETRSNSGYRFMQDQILPRRTAALAITDRIQQASEKQMNASGEALAALLASFRAKLLMLLILSVLIGIAWAGTALWRLLRLEQESLRRFKEILNAREELKRLSGELVSAQENERRRISRELDDEVGQVLSAIVLGLGNLRSALRNGNTDESFHQLQLVQDMTERNVSVVRNISLLLRPAMLDDLGLVPALNWLAREVSRNTAVAVSVLVNSFPDDLPEEHRTCIFRVVQEAVQIAARHSGTRQVTIRVDKDGSSIRLSVHDDGKGLPASQEAGPGILGMQERVTRLGGELKMNSDCANGATVSFTLPLAEKVVHAYHSPSASGY
jgi:signal transduction histidine kinase